LLSKQPRIPGDPRASLGVQEVRGELEKAQLPAGLLVLDHGKYGNFHCRQYSFLFL